jgi:uncharacterized membrane protein (DUF485 family)
MKNTIESQKFFSVCAGFMVVLAVLTAGFVLPFVKSNNAQARFDSKVNTMQNQQSTQEYKAIAAKF